MSSQLRLAPATHGSGKEVLLSSSTPTSNPSTSATSLNHLQRSADVPQARSTESRSSASNFHPTNVRSSHRATSEAQHLSSLRIAAYLADPVDVLPQYGYESSQASMMEHVGVMKSRLDTLGSGINEDEA